MADCQSINSRRTEMSSAQPSSRDRLALRATALVAGVAAILPRAALANPLESQSNPDAAMLLLALGVAALLLGLRNLRALGYKPLTPRFRRQLMQSACSEDRD
jgi:hypothetical protein